MNSRSGLKIGLFAVLALVGALVWFLSKDSALPGPKTVAGTPAAPSNSPSQAPAPVLADPGRADAAPTEGRAIAAAVPVVERPIVPEKAPPEEPIEAPLQIPPGGNIEKPSTLVPITGGAAAIANTFRNSTYETRFERLRVLEVALEVAPADDQEQMDARTALKDEYVWLRDNLGKPPK